MLWIADTHIGLNKDNPIFHKVVLDLFKEIIDTCVKKDISDVVVLGDFFHSRKAISQKSLETARQILEIFGDEDITLYLIRGNHDTLSDSAPNPNWLTNLKLYKNVKTIEEEVVVLNKKYSLVPWNHSLEDINTEYVLGHFAINSFLMNNSYECDGANLSPSDFKKFSHVWSGHFHVPSTKGNITYLGSPYQQTFNDVDSDRGYYIVKNEKVEFIKFTEAPRFYKISTEEIDKKKIPGNFIKLIFEKDYGNTKNSKLIESVEVLEPLLLLTDTSRLREENKTEALKEEDIISSNEDLLFDYLEKQEIPEHLNKKVLIKFVDRMLKDE